MLGRGVKRKWSCLEEELLPAVLMEEKERQLEEEESELWVAGKSEVEHLQQRQVVLGLCLQKLQRYQAGVELSLRRSVLMVNTLRQIQYDMRSDGTETCHPDVLLGAVHPESHLLNDDFREDKQLTCPGCAEEGGDDLPLTPPLSPELLSVEVNSSQTGEQQKPLDATSTFNAMGYLSDLALDDIFEDIDTSMYETSDLPSAWASGPSWPISLSLWTDEDVKTRSLAHGSSLQTCLMDLNELDHILEILVTS